MVTKKRDSKRPKSRGKNISRRPERIGYCPDEGFDYKAVGLLKKYISETGKIDSAKRNGLSSKCQRSLTTAVKRARHMALLPFASNHNYDTSLLDIGKRDTDNVPDKSSAIVLAGSLLTVMLLEVVDTNSKYSKFIIGAIRVSVTVLSVSIKEFI